jgi:maltooligosyltrehalose trehalohydrolase
MGSDHISAYSMPFGAQYQADGVRFRLWSPGASAELIIEGRAAAAMCERDGWFELTVPQLDSGTRYAYRLNGELQIPDPASRFQPEDCTSWSAVVDPGAYRWEASSWLGRPWDESVIYEIHVGTFTPNGTFRATIDRLDYLQALGVTAIELMPIGDFPGKRGWGYDGVLVFSPDSAYGTPEDLKALVDAAHGKGMMVFLDVVYNHFGPHGNFLGAYAPQFFTERFHTPWGAAVNFDADSAAAVRQFYVHNALYWLQEYRFDGLRFDAVHAIYDDSQPHILDEIAAAVRTGPGSGRYIHLILENDDNHARYLDPRRGAHFDAQWNDDSHHALHVLLANDRNEHYQDYANDPIAHLGRLLTEGFAFQGEWSAYRRARRGEPSLHLPPEAFVNFLQNHDQVGNRPLGERIGHLIAADRVRLATALVLLAPAIPLLFMGEEWDASAPFLFFCDFDEELAAKVRAGRPPDSPDPNSPATFRRCKLDWSEIHRPLHADRLSFVRGLLQVRRELLAIRRTGQRAAQWSRLQERGIRVRYRFGTDADFVLTANISDSPLDAPAVPGALVYALKANGHDEELPAWALRAQLAQR